MRPYLQQIELQFYEIAKADNFSELFRFHLYGDEVRNNFFFENFLFDYFSWQIMK